MKVREEEFEDQGEADEQGFSEYQYKGKYFYFEVASEKIKLRMYDDTPEEIAFLSFNDESFSSKTIGNPILQRIANYLRERGFTKFKILYGKNGYEDFPLQDS